MNATIDLLLQRKTIRAYTGQPIPEEEKNLILRAAMRAPTAGNMMLYSILDVQDQALKDRLAVTCDHQPFIAKAPLLLLFLADYQRWFDSYVACGMEEASRECGIPFRRPSEGDLFLACCDALIAAQSAVIAAEALGVGSCYIGDILERYEEHRGLFDLPPYAFPITLICFGYPTPQQSMLPLRPRFDPRFILHSDRYQRLTKAEIEEMHAANTGRLQAAGPRNDGIQNSVELNFMRKYSADFSLEMTRSVREMLSHWKSSPTD